MIWQVIVYNEQYYFSNEYKAIQFIEKFGKIVKQNNDKILCDKNGFLTRIILKSFKIDRQ